MQRANHLYFLIKKLKLKKKTINYYGNAMILVFVEIVCAVGQLVLNSSAKDISRLWFAK